MDIVAEILRLKKERNAVILAHNYQRPEVQDIADYVGDSLGLSIQAAETKADVIVFCGVLFMAETAKILNPSRIVLIPEKKAGCPMADMITPRKVREMRKQHPNAKVLCYVNSSAEVKAECDIICTSGNAIKIVNEAFKPDDEIIFIPDRFLASYVQYKTGHKLIIGDGFCPTHARILPENIEELKNLHPDAVVLVHPECRSDVIKIADAVLSTEGMLNYTIESDKQEFIIGTEIGIIHRMKLANPNKQYYPATDFALCFNMKMTTLEKVLWSLQDMKYEVLVDPAIMDKARESINRMLEYR
jgi:quinolinate synthase